MGTIIRVGIGIIMGLIFAGLGHCGIDARDHLVERVAVIEHDQWTEWSKAVAPEVSRDRRARWEKLWVPYKDLPEKEKESDRVWARRALDAAGL